MCDQKVLIDQTEGLNADSVQRMVQSWLVRAGRLLRGIAPAPSLWIMRASVERGVFMLNRWRRRAAWCCAALLVAFAILAHAEEPGRFYGMLALARSDTLRLPASRHASGARGEHRETHLRLRSRARLPEHLGAERKRGEVPSRRSSPGRREIGPAEIDAIRNLPGENYLFDLESATLDMAVHYKILEPVDRVRSSRRPSPTKAAFLDSTIEGFHDLVGPQQLRPSAPSIGNGTRSHLRPQDSETGVLVRMHRRVQGFSTLLSGCATAASHCRAAGKCRLRPR